MSISRAPRQAIRALLRRPAFLIVATLSLAIGIGAPSTMFSAIQVLLLQPLPYPQPDRLVAIYTTTSDGSRRQISMLEIEDLRLQAASLDGLAGYRGRSFGLSTDDGATRVVQAGMITSGFFQTLRTPPALGREFSVEEIDGELPLVVLSDPLWREQFEARADIVGMRVRLNDATYTVTGVASKGLAFTIDGQIPDLWIPLSRRDYGASRRVRSLHAIGRIDTGDTPDLMQSELETIAADLATAYPETNRAVGLVAVDFHEAEFGSNRLPLKLLFAAAGLLLLIACTNVAGLQLEHGAAAQRDIAVHRALGAGARHLAPGFLIEGAVLALAGGMAGFVVSDGLAALLPTLIPLLGGSDAIPARTWSEIGDARHLWAFMLPTLAIVAILFAVVPAFAARRIDLRGILCLRSGATAPASRFRSGLVIAQVSISVVLLLGSGLLVRGFIRLNRLDPGFSTRQVMLFGIGLPEARYDERAIADFHRELVIALEAIPGVESAAATFRVPLAGGAQLNWQFEGEGRERREWHGAGIHIATPGYTDLLAIPRFGGRDFLETDNADAPRVVRVNRAWVHAYSSDRDPIGRRLELSWRNGLNPRRTIWEVVGVVGDVRQTSLEQAPGPGLYLPMAQFPAEGAHYVLRTTRRDGDLRTEVRAAVAQIDPALERVAIEPLQEVVRRSLGSRRVAMTFAVSFASAALGLTLVGIYGLVSAIASRRQRELAVRGALGATRGAVFRVVLRQGIVLCGAGLVLGTLIFAVVGRPLAGMLLGVRQFDPPTIVAVAAIVITVGAIASWLPAIRATRRPLADLLRQLCP